MGTMNNMYKKKKRENLNPEWNQEQNEKLKELNKISSARGFDFLNLVPQWANS